MLDASIDQASGLRRSLRRRRGPILPVAGAGEFPDFVGRLARALSDEGMAVAVVSDFDALLEELLRGRARRGLLAVHALHAGVDLQQLDEIAQSSELTLVAVDDRRLARGLSLSAQEAVVVAGTQTEQLATAYARVKALAGPGSIRDVCALFERGTAELDARRGHRRLAATASRFLGVEVAFGGAARAGLGCEGYRKLAQDLSAWAAERCSEGPWRRH